MRICAAADFHLSSANWQHCERVARTMCDSGADVIVLAGDIATGSEKHYRKLLRLFANFSGSKLFVPGNHDLWSAAFRPDTPRRYRESLRRIVEAHGFHYLPGSPVVVDGIGFVGTVGWYDYDFRQLRTPRPGLTVSPLSAQRTRRGIQVRPRPGREDVSWEDLEPADYAGHALVWSDDNVWKELLWNDALYVRWGLPDPEVTRLLAQELARDVNVIEARVDQWVGVLHMVPFSELAGGDAEDVETAYVRAFAGSPIFGHLFFSHPKCRLVLCGHRHHRQVVSIGHIVAANCSVGTRTGGPLLLTIDGAPAVCVG